MQRGQKLNLLAITMRPNASNDVISTGTPPGVDLGMKPQRFLKAGDEMRLGIEGLGGQRQAARQG